MKKLFRKIRHTVSLFRSNHYVLISVTEKQIVELLDGKDMSESVTLKFSGLHTFVVFKLMQGVAESIPQEDLILEKAHFMAKLDEIKAKKSSN